MLLLSPWLTIFGVVFKPVGVLVGFCFNCNLLFLFMNDLHIVSFSTSKASPLVPETKPLTLFAIFFSWAWHFVHVAICVGFISHPGSTTVTGRDIAYRAELPRAMMLGTCATFPHAFLPSYI